MKKIKIMKTKRLLILFLTFLFIYGCSTSSDGNGNSTTTVVPIAPSNLSGVVTSATQINLSWTDNSTNETGFKIERKTGTGVYAVVGNTGTDISTFSDNGLTPSTIYTYRVYSINAVGNSLTYSNELTITNAAVTDIDGNNYSTITICNQIWTTTNLNVTKYKNGDVIPQVTDATQWGVLSTGAWCYYANTSSNGTTYGKLYNWYAVNDPRGLAPVGYHIPTDDEWTTLTTCLGGDNVAGGKMKETGTAHWLSPNTSATNSSNFKGLPGGYRANNGLFYAIGDNGNWWSSSVCNVSNAWYRYLVYNGGGAYRYPYGYDKTDGFSIRCIKD